MAKKRKGADKLVVQNAAKTVVANIRFASVDNPIKSIVITSSIPNEGKTSTACQIVQAMATAGSRVLLVECDMRRRSVADMLGVHTRGGIYAVLSESMTLRSAIAPTQYPGVDFLDSEPSIPNPADILASKRFARLVRALESEYDFVVFDTPPVGTFVDAAILSTLVDATLLVVRDNFTRRDDVLKAYDQLQKAEANVIGTIMNACEAESSEYYYAYYNKDGKRVKTSDSTSQQTPAFATPMPAKRGARGVSHQG